MAYASLRSNYTLFTVSLTKLRLFHLELKMMEAYEAERYMRPRKLIGLRGFRNMFVLGKSDIACYLQGIETTAMRTLGRQRNTSYELQVSMANVLH